MKKDNKLVKFTMLVLLITIVAIVLVSGTYAKYTSKVSGESTATVAKWSIEVNDKEMTVANSQVKFNLFDTIYDTGNTAVETDVVNKRIAPGTSGGFELKIENLSEVTAKYSIDFVLTNSKNIPIEFSTDNGANWTKTLATINSTDNLNALTEPDTDPDTDTIKVQWRWVYEVKDSEDANLVDANVDVADTKFGTDAQTTAATVTVTTTLTATQVD